MTELNINWVLFDQHASVDAIEHHLALGQEKQRRVASEVRRLKALLRRRREQIAAGEWP